MQDMERSLALRLLMASRRFRWLRVLSMTMLGVVVIGSIDYQAMYRKISRVWLHEGRWTCVCKPLPTCLPRKPTGYYKPGYLLAESEIGDFVASRVFKESFSDVPIFEYTVTKDEHPVIEVSIWTNDKNLSQICIEKFKALFLAHIAEVNAERDDKALWPIRHKLDHARDQGERESIRRELLECQERLRKFHAEHDWVYEEI